MKSDSGWITEEEQIKEHVNDYFRSLFSSSSPRDFEEELRAVPKCISGEMNTQLWRPVLELEIMDAAFQLGDLKAPGPDGFSGILYQKNRSIIGSSVCKAVKCFFEWRFILKEINQAFIALIPKIQNPAEVSHFRPISLCNFLYKIIAKSLPNRLKSILPCLISLNQAAFVPSRLIQDSIVVVHEAFHYLNCKWRGNQKDEALKIDLNKAYDIIEWDFLIATIERMGFDRRWVDLIFQYISSVSFRVLINGEPSLPFRQQRGLRQGDLLSPYLFCWCKKCSRSIS